MSEVVYDFHGVTFLVRTDEPAVAASVDRRLRWFRTSDAAPADRVVTIRTGVDRDELPRQPAGDCRAVYDTPLGAVFYNENLHSLWLRYDRSTSLWLEADTGRIDLWSADTGTEAEWLVSHPLLTVALIETLKRCDRFSVHAAAVAPRKDEAILFPGASGAGKTTLAVAMLHQGWEFLADDMVFLTSDPSGVTVLGFADEVDVSDETLARFPTLKRSAGVPAAAGRAKRPVMVEDAFGVEPTATAHPAAVVFPKVADRLHSVLTSLDPGDALSELAPNVLLTEPASSAAHLHALAALVEQVPCWRLETGQDFERLAESLAALSDER